MAFQATWIFQKTLDALRAGTPYIWSEGGTRSGKTHNETAACLVYAAETGRSVDFVRATNTALKGSLYQEDLLPLARGLGLYDERRHNKTDQYFMVGTARIRYFGADNDQKLRGWKRDVLLMNEANEFSAEARRQLWMRTTQTIIVEHNPTIDDEHWIPTLLEPQVATGECVYFHSTYLDNPFLPAGLVRQIEAMQDDDPYGWQVYGLGLRGTHASAVFTDVALGAFRPQGETVYGVDFGYNHPFVVIEWGWRDKNPPAQKRAVLYARPLIFDTHMTTGQVIERLDEMGADRDKPMICDSAEPDRILELYNAGYNAYGVTKRQGFTQASYEWMKRHTLVVDSESDRADVVKSQLRRTRHKKKPGTDTYTDEVVKLDDDAADSGRYTYDLLSERAELKLVY